MYFIEPEFNQVKIPTNPISCGYFPYKRLEVAGKHACLNYNLKLPF